MIGPGIRLPHSMRIAHHKCDDTPTYISRLPKLLMFSPNGTQLNIIGRKSPINLRKKSRTMCDGA